MSQTTSLITTSPIAATPDTVSTDNPALIYLKARIVEFAEQPSNDQRDAGCLDGMIEMLENVFGIVAVFGVTFVPKPEGA
jgi:hypothetical protein